MRAAVVLLILGASTAAAAPAPAPAPPSATTCADDAKPFTCHARALELHLGIDRAPDLAAAAHLYALACDRKYAPSCNNLAVLAATHRELAQGVDPMSLWTGACKRLEPSACDNARRYPVHPELAVELSLVDPNTVDAARERALIERACGAGDLYRCDDPATRARVAALLAEECRGGAREECLDAANAAASDGDFIALAGLACDARDGRACAALAARRLKAGASDDSVRAQWRGACVDDDFDTTGDDVVARDDACRRWGAKANKAELATIARVEAARCSRDDLGACRVATDTFERAGAASRAFAIVKTQCEDLDDDTACDDLGDRYVLADGTPRAIDKRVALRGYACDAPTAWRICKDVAAYAIKVGSAREAGAIYDGYCTSGLDEACYLGARAGELAKQWCTGTWDSIDAIDRTYAALCAKHYGDACRRAAGMCALAMKELVKSRESCGYGVGDGTEHQPPEYEYLIAHCPRATWSPAAQRAAKALESYWRDFERSGGTVEP